MGWVLVVEDDPAFLELVCLVLREEGYEVVGMSNGGQALKAIEAGEPDLVLLDMEMPVMSGWQFLASYRQACGHTAPVIAMSGSSAVLDHPADWLGVLMKPFDLDTLLACVKSHTVGSILGD